MRDTNPRPHWSLPYESPLPAEPGKRRWVKAARIALYVLLAGALITPAIQFQVVTMKNLRAGQEYDRRAAAGELRPDEKPPKAHKGAIGRWRKAVRLFWKGENIYTRPAEVRDAAGNAEELTPEDEGSAGEVWLHPHMPFTVILLTPFAYMPVWVTALSFNILKLLAVVAAGLMAVRIANHGARRMADWVVLLGLLWGLLFIVGDIQHGNTNCFVLALIVLHLWLYRRGQDIRAGAALAVAICLKMTPALFLLYWLYQRNWRLLVAAAAVMALLTVVIPAAAVGPEHYVDLTETWLENLIVPGLLKGAWYPIHINQSISGVFSRYFLDGPNGNIFWNPDDNTYDTQEKFAWITLVALSPETVKLLIRTCQFAVVAFIAWAIGWRKLPRDDGRRALHYGLIAIGIVLLNQRTWDHHAGILLIAEIAIWYAIAFGRFSRAARAAALILMLLAGPLLWLTGTETFGILAKFTGHSSKVGGIWADVVDAYGPAFYHFVLLLAASIILCTAIRRSGQPYAKERQRLSR